MPGLMHGMSAPRMSKSKRKSRSAERHKRGGGARTGYIPFQGVKLGAPGLVVMKRPPEIGG